MVYTEAICISWTSKAIRQLQCFWPRERYSEREQFSVWRSPVVLAQPPLPPWWPQLRCFLGDSRLRSEYRKVKVPAFELKLWLVFLTEQRWPSWRNVDSILRDCSLLTSIPLMYGFVKLPWSRSLSLSILYGDLVGGHGVEYHTTKYLSSFETSLKNPTSTPIMSNHLVLKFITHCGIVVYDEA